MVYDLIVYDKNKEVVYRSGEEEYIADGYFVIESQGKKVEVTEKDGKMFVKNGGNNGQNNN
jgi:hypothetical protein